MVKVLRSSVQLLSHIRLFVTAWTAAHQASLSITNSHSLLKLMSIESVMPSHHLSHPLLSPTPPAFNLSQHQSQFFAFCGQSIRVSASVSVFRMNIQD